MNRFRDFDGDRDSQPGNGEESAFEHRRQALVGGLRARGIRDERVLGAMNRIPRHFFCQAGDEQLAYEDGVLPLPNGATLSQPYVVAAMLEALALRGNERVLDIGSGSGYTTALLCELAGAVYAVERDPLLLENGEERLRHLSLGNVHWRQGDGWDGWMDHFPYDGILVSAAAPCVPPELLDQLSPGGRMVIPIGGDSQRLRVFHSTEDGSAFENHDLFSVRFVPLVRDPSAN